MQIYEATQNSDQTEGRGHEATIAYFDNLDEAVKAVKGKGVMGVGDGDVNSLCIYTSVEELNAHGIVSKIKIYGYRKDRLGKWGCGYIDNRDAPLDDPEYVEYLRLRKKFGS